MGLIVKNVSWKGGVSNAMTGDNVFKEKFKSA